MRLSRFAVCIVQVGLMVLVAGLASGQNYPSKPVRILSSSGGAVEFTARLIAQGISGPLGQAVIVEPRVSLIATETVARAAPDGYTLLVQGTGFWVAPLLEKTSYDPVRDFSPITMSGTTPNLLVVHPSLPVKSVKELIALAKAKPGELHFSFSGIGGANHLAGELFKAMAGVNFTSVKYKGGAVAINGLLSGETQLSFPAAGSAQAFVKSGKLKALAVTSAQPSVLVPGVPTVAASGLPGYEAISIQSMLAPANTPAAIISRLNQESVRILNNAETKERMLNFGLEAVASSPEHLASAMKSEMVKLGKLIKDAGIKME